MSIEDTATGRSGSGPDLARRMDRMESRQDEQAKQIADIRSAVDLVVVNQRHADEINSSRHELLKAAIADVGKEFKDFSARINALISGEIRLPQQTEMLADWTGFRGKTESRLDALEDQQAKTNGVWVAIGGFKGAVVAIAAIASPVIVLVGILLRP